MVKDWEPLQDEIRNAYHVQNKSLSEVMRLVKGRHGFIASERSYRTQLQKWGYMKYNTQRSPKPTRISGPGTQSKGQGPLTRAVIHDLGSSSVPPNVANVHAFDSTGVDSYFGIEASSLGANSDGQYMNIDLPPSHSAFPFHQEGQQNDGKSELHRAVIGRNFEQVRTLLFAGVTIHVKDNVANSALHYAVISNDFEIVVLLLRFGADVHAKGQLGRTPLHLAISNVTIVNALFKEGAEASPQDEKGDTPLHLAIDASFEVPSIQTIIETLLGNGCAVNTANLMGATPLQKLLDCPRYTCWNLQNVLSLLKHGAATTEVYPDGRKPVQVFLSRTNDEWAQYFGSPNIESKVLRAFLEGGACPVATMPTGEHLALHFVRSMSTRWWDGDWTLVSTICDVVDPDLVAENGNSLLHELAAICHTPWDRPAIVAESMAILLRRGANSNHQNHHGQTPLLLMFRGYRKSRFVEPVIATLLEYGADPWLQDSSGCCAMYEVAGKSWKMRESILKALFRVELQRLAIISHPASKNEQRAVWHEWEQAAQNQDWNEMKHLVFDHHNTSLSKDSDKILKSSAFAVLAERHLCMVKGKFRGEPEEIGRRRNHLALILRDCRARDVTVDMKHFDDLVDLCV